MEVVLSGVSPANVSPATSRFEARCAQQGPQECCCLSISRLARASCRSAPPRRFGGWGDWQEPYCTLHPSYEAAQLGVFSSLLEKGLIYRGLRPVNWSPSSRTALADAELDYPEGHVS